MAVLLGLEKLESEVGSLALRVRRKLLTKVTKIGAESIRAEMERTAPRLTGHLSEREIISVRASESSADVVIVRIGPAKDAFYGVWEEFGSIHNVPDPFVEPSFEAKYPLALKVASNEFRIEVEKNGR